MEGEGRGQRRDGQCQVTVTDCTVATVMLELLEGQVPRGGKGATGRVGDRGGGVGGGEIGNSR